MAEDWERTDTGSPDPTSLAAVRTVATKHEPLVNEAGFDDAIDPHTLHLHVGAGIRADSGRFDVTWTDEGYYRYHYTEGDDFNYRYDRHPRRDVPEKHFHEPPDAGHDAVQSPIEVETVQLVTIAVLQLWRDAVESGAIDCLRRPNPP